MRNLSNSPCGSIDTRIKDSRSNPVSASTLLLTSLAPFVTVLSERSVRFTLSFVIAAGLSPTARSALVSRCTR